LTWVRMESGNVRDEVSTARVSGWVKESVNVYERYLLDCFVECAIEPRSGGIVVALVVSPGIIIPGPLPAGNGVTEPGAVATGSKAQLLVHWRP